MSDQIQNLVINLGAVIVASIPILAAIFGWSTDKTGEMQKQILAVVSALAVLAASMWAIWHANQTSLAKQQNKIEAVKALSNVQPEHKEERAKFLGMKPE